MIPLAAFIAGLAVGAPLWYLLGHVYGFGVFQTIVLLSFCALFVAGALAEFRVVGDV